MQYATDGRYFNGADLLKKHSKVRVAFLVIPPLLDTHLVNFAEIYGFSLHVHNDLIIYLVNKSVRQKVGYIFDVVIKEFCTFRVNTLVVEYGLERDLWNGISELVWLGVPCRKEPLCLWIIRPSLYNIMPRLRQMRRDLQGYPVDVMWYSPVDPQKQLRFLIRRTGPEVVPHAYLAQKFNFTLRDFEDTPMNSPCLVGLIQLRLAKGGVEAPLNIFFQGWSSDMLMYGSDLNNQSPFYLSSLLTPFPWYFWTILLAAICMNVTIVLRKATKKDMGEAILSVVGPLVNQAPSSIPRGLYFWTLIWIFLMLYLNNAYLGVLDSLKTVPEVVTDNASLEELVERNFTFYAEPTLVKEYEILIHGLDFNLEEQSRLTVNSTDEYYDTSTVFYAESSYDDYRLLTKSLKAKAIHNSSAGFWKLESAAWLGSSKSLVVLKGFLVASFRRNYHVLKRAFKSLPTWTQIYIPQADDGVLVAYKWLTDTGINGYWGELEERVTSRYEGHQLLGIKGLTDPDFQGARTPAVGLEESLILEALFLYGVGIALGSLSLLVQVIRSNNRECVLRLAELWRAIKTLRTGKRTQGRNPAVNCLQVLGVKPSVKLRPLRLLQKVRNK